MTDKDRQEQEEAAIRDLLDAYAKLVAMTAIDSAKDREATTMIESIDQMTESQAKAMLMAKIGADAVATNEAIGRMMSSGEVLH